MAYFSRKNIIDYVNDNLHELESKNLKPLNTLDEVVKKLNDEDDMVGFFWIEYNDLENSGEKIKFQGKSFVRVDSDIYTDDRFAIDLYESTKMNVTVSDVIKKREEDKEIAKKGIINTQELEQRFKENTNKNGAT